MYPEQRTPEKISVTIKLDNKIIGRLSENDYGKWSWDDQRGNEEVNEFTSVTAFVVYIEQQLGFGVEFKVNTPGSRWHPISRLLSILH